MPRSTLTAILLSAILLCSQDGTATDVDAHAIVEICLLPHQTGICDVIFTGTVADGTVVSNDEECAAGFTVDDVLWGHVNSSNITVRSIARNYMPNARPFGYVSGERYLVCAFTNNWWASQTMNDMYYDRLWGYLSVTSAPPGNAVFDDYRTMFPRYTAIPFSQINYNGSNYWPTTRALVTNLVDIARVQGDNQLMRQTITNIVGNGWAKSGVSPVIWSYLQMYKEDRYDWTDSFSEPLPLP